MGSLLRTLIADNHPPFRDVLAGIVRSIRADADCLVACSLDEALAALSSGAFDLVFAGLDLPGMGGLGSVVGLVNQAGGAALVVLADGHPPQVARLCRMCGVAGLVEKSAPPDRITRAVTMALRGGLAFPDTLAIPASPQTLAGPAVLTRKQLQVLARLAAGGSNKQIAKDLGLSPNTVKAHVSEILRRLAVTSRAQAIAIMREPWARDPALVSEAVSGLPGRQ